MSGREGGGGGGWAVAHWSAPAAAHLHHVVVALLVLAEAVLNLQDLAAALERQHKRMLAERVHRVAGQTLPAHKLFAKVNGLADGVCRG